MKKFDPEKITLKEYIDAAEKLCKLMYDQDCKHCPLDDGPLHCKKSAIDSGTAKNVFEKLEETKQDKSPYELVRQDLFNMCTDRKVTFGGCKGCQLRLGDRYCMKWFFEEMFSEIERWKNEQSTGD